MESRDSTRCPRRKYEWKWVLAFLRGLQVVYSGTSLCLCLQRQPRTIKDIVDVRGPLRVDAWPPGSFRLSEHGSCFALRLPSHLLHLPSGDLAESGCSSPGVAALVLPASFCLQRVHTRIPSRDPQPSFLKFLLFAVKVTEAEFAQFSPPEAQVEVLDMLKCSTDCGLIRTLMAGSYGESGKFLSGVKHVKKTFYVGINTQSSSLFWVVLRSYLL